MCFALSKARHSIYFIIIFLSFFSACNKKTQDYHPEYFDKYYTQLDSTYALTTRMEIMDSIESALYRYPVGVGDKVKYYRARMNYFLDIRNYKKVFLYLDSTEDLIRDRRDDAYFLSIYAGGLTIRSNCYLHLKNYNASLDYLLQARNVKSSDNPCDMAFYSERMAELFYQLRRYRVAAGYFRNSLNETEQCKDRPLYDKFQSIQGDLDNIGLCFVRAEMYDSAGYYFNKAMDYISQNEPLYPQQASFINLAKAVVKANFGKIKFQEKKYEASEKMSLESIAVTENVYEEFTLSSKLSLAEMYIEWNKLDKAEKVLLSLDSMYHFRQSPDLAKERMDWSLNMQRLWLKKKDTVRAFDYNSQYIAVRDSLDLLEKNDVTRDLGQELENKEQRAANIQLEKQNAIKSFQLTIAVLLSIMTIGIIVFTWYSLRKSAKNVQLLQGLNKQISDKNKELSEAFASLEKSQSENTRITRMVAHDLKNPIGGIRNLVYSMLKKETSEESRGSLDLIKTSCDDSIVLINDLVKEGKGDLNSKESVDLHRVVQYCVNILQTKADEKNQRLLLEGDPVLVPINREKIWRVISNVLNNAIKFSPDDAIINVKLQKKGASALLSVEDQGIGIPADLTDKIFTSQPEASRLGTAGEESHGLGLSISLKIVEEHNGRMWFESNEGGGCTFYIELPLKNMENAA